jgi:hypothetical protein
MRKRCTAVWMISSGSFQLLKYIHIYVHVDGILFLTVYECVVFCSRHLQWDYFSGMSDNVARHTYSPWADDQRSLNGVDSYGSV